MVVMVTMTGLHKLDIILVHLHENCQSDYIEFL